MYVMYADIMLHGMLFNATGGWRMLCLAKKSLSSFAMASCWWWRSLASFLCAFKRELGLHCIELKSELPAELDHI